MAKMFPSCLCDDVKSPAERLLYQEFQNQLPDNFAIFHAISWQINNSHSGVKDGEVDFIVACPNLGILVMEVKGGSIRYDNTKNEWYSDTHSIKDPFRQACQSKYSLLNLLKDKPYWSQRWISVGHVVAFPNVVVNDRLRLDAPREIILDSTQLKSLLSWVHDVFKYYHHQDKHQSEFDEIGLQQLTQTLSQSIKINRSMSSEIRTQENELIRLSEQQFRLLDFLGKHQRVAISGCAGSGKTLLALEKAYRLNEQGFSVLLTCFNKGLAEFLRKSVGKRKGLYVCHFHALCKKLALKAGIDLSVYQNYDLDVLFNEIYPELLVDAASKLNWRVDAVIVDEGQDFGENLWLALKCLLNDPDQGTFYYFYDDNQNIFDHYWKPPLEEVPFTLTENWRNTKQIHSYLLQFYQGQHSTIASGTLGHPVQILDYTTNNQLKDFLGDLLHHLIVKEKVAAKDIVILTTRKMPLIENKVVGKFLVKANPDYVRDEIECHTIHHFKGLERSVVILVEAELRNVSYLKNLLYVGVSRARHHLIILRPDAPF